MLTDTVSPTLSDIRTKFVVEMIYQAVVARASHPLFPSPISGAIYAYFNGTIIPESVTFKVPEDVASVIAKPDAHNVPRIYIQIVQEHAKQSGFARTVHAHSLDASFVRQGDRRSWTKDFLSAFKPYAPEFRFEPKNLALPTLWKKGLDLIRAEGTAMLAPTNADLTWYKNTYIPIIGTVYGLSPVMVDAADREFSKKVTTAKTPASISKVLS